jgi:hypothetical protein
VTHLLLPNFTSIGPNITIKFHFKRKRDKEIGTDRPTNEKKLLMNKDARIYLKIFTDAKWPIIGNDYWQFTCIYKQETLMVKAN